MINELHVAVSIHIGFNFLDFNSWICKSRILPSFAYLECYCSFFRRVYVAKLVHGVFLHTHNCIKSMHDFVYIVASLLLCN